MLVTLPWELQHMVCSHFERIVEHSGAFNGSLSVSRSHRKCYSFSACPYEQCYSASFVVSVPSYVEHIKCDWICTFALLQTEMLCFALMSLYQSCLNFLSFLSMILVCHYYLSVPIKSRQICQQRRRQASALKCFYVSVLPYSVTAVDPCLSTAPRAETLYSVRLWLLWRMEQHIIFLLLLQPWQNWSA